MAPFDCDSRWFLTTSKPFDRLKLWSKGIWYWSSTGSLRLCKYRIRYAGGARKKALLCGCWAVVQPLSPNVCDSSSQIPLGRGQRGISLSSARPNHTSFGNGQKGAFTPATSPPTTSYCCFDICEELDEFLRLAW